MDKKYDWMALLQYQPNYTLADFKELGVTADNTSFKSRDYYKGLKDVRESPMFFNENDEFSESKFDKFYDQAAILYNNYANEDVFRNLANSKTYNPWEWWNSDASKIEDYSPFITTGKNKQAVTRSVKEFGVATESPFSIRELAQRNNYYDVTTGEWSDKTPNDYAGIFKSWSAPTLVLATYDEDTTETDSSGKQIIHKKGEIKVDDEGLPFYETLGDRDSSGKDFLHNEDIFSVDGEGWNKFDIWDADGKRTDGLKVAAHTIARVVPYLIPYVGEYYAYFNAFKNIAQFVPQFLKTVDGVITNDTMGNDFGRTMNDTVAWMNRIDHSVSDVSREHLATWENLGKLFADISGQLFEQKAVQNITQLAKNPVIKNNASLAKALSYGYMSTTSAEEAYDIFKQAGATDRTAGLAMWGLIGIYYKLMSADYYKHALFRNSWIDEKNIKEPTQKLINMYQEAIAKDPELAIATSEKAAAKTLNWFERAWGKVLGFPDKLEEAGVLGGKTWLSAALSEGTEEVLEEVGIDTLKALAKALEAIGVHVSDDQLNFGFSMQDVLQRYGTSFAGGALGGAVFHGYNLIDPKYRAALKAEKLPENVLDEIALLVMQGRQGEIYAELARGYKNKEYGSENLSATKFDVVRDVDGEKVAFEGANGEMSQNELVYNEAYKTIKYFENLLASENFKEAVKRVKDLTKIDDDRATLAVLKTGGEKKGPEEEIKYNAENLILNELKTIAFHIMDISRKMKVIEDASRPKDEDGGDTKLAQILQNDNQYQQLVKDLQYWRDRRDKIYNKEDIAKYLLQASFALNKDTMNAMLDFSDVSSYAQSAYGKPFNQFTPDQQYKIQQEYNSYFDGTKADIFEAAHIYELIGLRLANAILQKEAELKSLKPDETVSAEITGTEFLSKIRQIARLKSQIQDLAGKTEKTEEDDKNLETWNKELEELTLGVNELSADPQKLLTRAHLKTFEDTNLFEFANTLVEWYKSLQGGHKYDDSDLHRFINQVKNIYNRDAINRLFDEAFLGGNAFPQLTTMLDDDREALIELGFGIIENEEDYLFQESNLQNEFRDLLKSYYTNLDNPTKASEIYDSIRALLKERGKLSDDLIDEILFRTPINVDENENRIPAAISLIPYLGRPIHEILSEIEDYRKNISYSNGLDLLKDFMTIINDESLFPLIDLLSQEESRLTDVGEYVIGNDYLREQLKSLRSAINAVDAVISGAYNGLNTLINPYRKQEKLNELPIITENTAKIIHNDLENLKHRINFLFRLDAANSGQKLREQKDVGANMRRKFLAKIVNHLYLDDWKKEFGFDLKELLDKVTSPDFRIEEINTENYNEKEVEIIKFETELYNVIKELNISDEELADKLIKIYGDDNLYRLQSTKLTKEKDEEVTGYDTILYLGSLLTLNSNDFYVKYRDSIKSANETGTFDLVPVFGQEYALRLIYAYAKNHTFFNTLLAKIKASYKGNEDYQLNREL